ncbi:UNVERIFIED_CONTAM: hypothetical protein Sradi_4123700 [Sesamum radiatum]|uniref:Uncharacterized protein n=1 Tax=Sesamum radiatum TaxID=300843 RepID=A0AAW2P1D3_SESRA
MESVVQLVLLLRLGPPWGPPASSDSRGKRPAPMKPKTSSKRAKVSSLGIPPTSSARPAATPRPPP